MLIKKVDAEFPGKFEWSWNDPVSTLFRCCTT